MSSSSCSDDTSYDEEAFEWNKYLMVRNAEEVPDDFFYHICKSEQNGIEIGSVVEVENEDENGYWFASVCSSKGVLINLHYFGDENDKHDFWLEVKSTRIHSLNWGSDNNKKLIPPYPDRFLRVNPETIKEKVQNCEHVVSNAVLQMGGAPIYNIFKPEMFVEVQDKEYPYRVWVSKVLQNVGGRLFLKMEGESSPEKQPFWLFFMNDRIFPFGWAEQKGLPWRVMNLDTNIKSAIDSSSLLNVLKPKTPAQHTYKVGEMLEVINPYSLMVFYVGTIVKIYDNRYFKVEVDNDSDISKRITFVATKENPYLFEPGWASKHKCLLKPPSNWTTTNSFSWSKYVSMKNCKLAKIDNTCRKQIDSVHIGMKLEAVDPLDPSCIRVATVKRFADHWMFLSFDRTLWCHEILHVRSVYSDDIFPVGWCNKHKYLLSTPKLPFNDCDNYKNCYYVSDVEIDFDELDDEVLLKYPNYCKGDIPYHLSRKSTSSFADSLNESIEDILKENCVVENSYDSKTDNHKINVDIKVESPELDEEFHDALFSEREENAENSVEEESNISTEKEMHNNIEKENLSSINKNLFYTNNYKICIYFNKSCKPGSHIVRRKIAELPDSIGPGPVLNILQKAITILVNSVYFPVTSLKKIKNNENILFEDICGVPMLITTYQKSRSSYSELLTLPESKKMARRFCSALCNFYGMCEYFMTTRQTPCPNGCYVKVNTCAKLKCNEKTMPTSTKTSKRKRETIGFEKLSSINRKIAKVAEDYLDWTNISLVERYKYYLACLVHYESHTSKMLQSSPPNKLMLIEEILSKKHCLKMMDGVDDFKNTKSEIKNIDENDETLFMVDWKFSFENQYRCDPRFKKIKIDVHDLEKIEVTSNPKYWSPEDMFNYLSSDHHCKDIAKILFEEEVDGVAFMILTEEQLTQHLQCPINLAIRIMCHAAEAKYRCFTEYIDH